jgi:hypothetical protein
VAYARHGEMKNMHEVMVRKPEETSQLGKLICMSTYEVNVEMNLNRSRVDMN